LDFDFYWYNCACGNDRTYLEIADGDDAVSTWDEVVENRTS